MKPLSVLFLNPLGGGDWGGVETWMLAVARGLSERDFGIAAAARSSSRFLARFEEHGFPVETLAFRRDFGPLDIAKLRRILRRREVDVIVTKLDRGIRAAGLASRLGGGAAVVMRQGLFEVRPGFRHRFAYRWVDRIVTPADSIRKRIVETGVMPVERIDHVPNGVDAERFGIDPDSGRAFREALSIPDGPLLVNTSRLHDQKGHDVLLDAFATLGDEPHLLLAGAGKRETDIRARAESLGVANRVHLPGHVEDVPALLAAADLFVLSSRFEGMPNNVLEAMAAGLPIVSTAAGDVPLMLEDGETGRVVPTDDAAALGAALRETLDDAAAARAMGEAAKARAVREYPVKSMVDRTEDSLRRAVLHRRSR